MRLAAASLRGNCGEVERGGHQGAGVGVLGGGHDLLGQAGLDDLAVLHDEDLVRQGADDAEIVADEQIGEAVADCNSRNNSTICACTDMSSAEVGSSSTTKRGFNTNARAIAMR